MFCVMLMSWRLGGPLEDMGQVKLYLIHASSHCCRSMLELDFKVASRVQAVEGLVDDQTLRLHFFGREIKLT